MDENEFSQLSLSDDSGSLPDKVWWRDKSSVAGMKLVDDTRSMLDKGTETRIEPVSLNETRKVTKRELMGNLVKKIMWHLWGGKKVTSGEIKKISVEDESVFIRDNHRDEEDKYAYGIRPTELTEQMVEGINLTECARFLGGGRLIVAVNSVSENITDKDSGDCVEVIFSTPGGKQIEGMAYYLPGENNTIRFRRFPKSDARLQGYGYDIKDLSPGQITRLRKALKDMRSDSEVWCFDVEQMTYQKTKLSEARLKVMSYLLRDGLRNTSHKLFDPVRKDDAAEDQDKEKIDRNTPELRGVVIESDEKVDSEICLALADLVRLEGEDMEIITFGNEVLESKDWDHQMKKTPIIEIYYVMDQRLYRRVYSKNNGEGKDMTFVDIPITNNTITMGMFESEKVRLDTAIRLANDGERWRWDKETNVMSKIVDPEHPVKINLEGLDEKMKSFFGS